MGLSGLITHRMKYHFINESSCPKDMAPADNEEHIFLSCATDATQRQVLMAQINQIQPNQSNVIGHIENKRNIE